jgi:S-adenosylhomocysteine hydrolase
MKQCVSEKGMAPVSGITSPVFHFSFTCQVISTQCLIIRHKKTELKLYLQACVIDTHVTSILVIFNCSYTVVTGSLSLV